MDSLYRPSHSALPKAVVLMNSSNTPSGMIFNDDFDGELFGLQFSSSYLLIFDVAVLVGAVAVAVSSCCRCVPGWARRLGKVSVWSRCRSVMNSYSLG